MNMFEMYDSLHEYFMEGEGPGIPVIPTAESVKPQNTVNKMTASQASNPQAKPFPIKKVLITAGIIVSGYLLIEALIPKNNNTLTFWERRRLARKRASKLD